MKIEITSSEINGHQVRVEPATTSLIELIKALQVTITVISTKGFDLEVK